MVVMGLFTERAGSILGTAARDLHGLVEQAVRERRYDELSQLAHAVRQITTIAEGLGEGESEHHGGAEQTRDESEAVLARTAVEASSLRARKDSGDGLEYPRFVRDDDALVKVASSRSSGTTYEHRAPRPIVDVIVKRIIAFAENSHHPFTAEALSGLNARGSGSRVPGYQLYLCLAWLKRLGLLKQRGRKGYVVAKRDSFVADVEEAWKKLDRHE
jgi:hypothetical protein